MMNPIIEDSSLVDPSAEIGEGSRIWHNSQIRNQVLIGNNCIIGRNVYVGTGVRIGNNCKIQNNALIYEPAEIEDGVFIGPAVVLTNDQYPRAVNPDSSLKLASDWDSVGVSIATGASIGAGSICVAPVKIGAWAMVAAGAVVTKNVRNFALVAGVPARQIGWVGKSGQRLIQDGDMWICPDTKARYKLIDQELVEEK
jgi:acetyltransferase-like isoleucine patch superfamily enzyme